METREYELMAAAEDVHPWFIQLRTIIRESFESVGVRPEWHVLDVGCGTGGTMKSLAGTCRFTGLDASPLAAEMAERISGAKVVVADATRMPFADQTFDAVIASHILEHIDDDGAAVAGIRRVLKPGGPLVVLVPCHQFMYNHHDRALHHVRRYSRRDFIELLEQNGFTPQKIIWTNPIMYPPAAAARIVSRILRPADGAGDGRGSDTTARLGLASHLVSAIASIEVRLMWKIPAPFGVGLLVLAR